MSSAAQFWEQIVTAALVGTERQGLPAPPEEAAWGELLARLGAADAEGALLGAAATVGLYRRAGWLPAVDGRSAPEPCPPEVAPRCSPRAAQRLAAIMAEERLDLLPEWLRTAAGAGVRVPEGALPELLEMALTRPELAELLMPVAGERGRWLAALNPAWNLLAAAQAEDEELWETGSRAERLVLLQRLRTSHPERARERVAATWAADAPEDRARFLASFRTGLSMADEPFLEEALDDRRKEVRQAAADLLARLPECRLCRRMLDRLLSLLTIRRGLRGEVMEVQLPEACDKAMVRDGIEPRPRREGMGEKTAWVMQMLAVVPPAAWETRWGKPPAALIALAQGEWQLPLLGGWSQAAGRHGDAAWAEALLRAWLPRVGGDRFQDPWWELAAVLPVERREALSLELLREERGWLRASQVMLLRECRHAWSPALTRAVMDSLRRHFVSGDREADYEVRELLRDSVHRIPVELGPEVAAGWMAASEGWGAWEEEVHAFLARLHFRHEMLKDFQ